MQSTSILNNNLPISFNSFSAQSSSSENTETDTSPEILRVNDRILTALDLLLILGQQRLMNPLVQSVIIDEAITPFQPNLEEQTIAYQELRKQYQLESESDYSTWLASSGLTSREFYQLAIRSWQIAQFKQEKWGAVLQSYFIERKSKLDQVVYSLIRTRDQEKALELYHRIREKESSFAEIATQYSEGGEAYTNGLIGPVEISQIHPIIAQQLHTSQPGELWIPTQIDEWSVIIRLEHFLSSQLDSLMEQKLLNELFEKWILEKVRQAELSFLFM